METLAVDIIYTVSNALTELRARLIHSQENAGNLQIRITSTEQGAATAIMWITTENTAFNISGFLSVEDLIAMAESLYEK